MRGGIQKRKLSLPIQFHSGKESGSRRSTRHDWEEEGRRSREIEWKCRGKIEDEGNGGAGRAGGAAW